jgi:saccharopine dehydrogenase-like NADP-dependent oxidoreductase
MGHAGHVRTGSILIVGGYGVVGSRIAADLAPDFPDRVIVAGRHRNRADAAAAAIGHGARGQRIDVTDASSTAQALDSVAVAVNCIDQPDRALLWAAIERGLAYTDITPHLVDLGRGQAFEHVDSAAKAAGARVLLGAGMVPGISNVIVRALMNRVGGADRIETSLLLSADDLSGPASFDYLLQELAMVFNVHVDNADHRTRPFTQPRAVDYPAPVGTRRAYLFPFSDQVLYPRTTGARTVLTRLSIDPPRLGRLLAFMVRTRIAGIVARQPVRSMLARLRQRDTNEAAAPYALRVDVAHGQRTATAMLTGRGQAQATATGTAALVRCLAMGEIAEPGAWMPDQVIDPTPYLQRLARAGIHVELVTRTKGSAT